MPFIASPRPLFALLPAAALLMAGPLAGQVGSSPELRLARALTQQGSPIELRVGELPEGFPREILPAGATVLGHASDEWHHRVAITFDAPYAAAERQLTEALAANGWQYVQEQGFDVGFVSLDEVVAMRPRMGVFCKDGQTIRPSPRSSMGSSDVIVSWRTRSFGGACGETPAIVAAAPRLTSPAELPLRSTGHGVSDREVHVRAIAPDRIPIEELAALFEAQLMDQGWEVHPVDRTNNHTSLSAVKTDEDDTRWSAFLSITRVPVSSTISLELWTLDEAGEEGDLRWEAWSQ